MHFIGSKLSPLPAAGQIGRRPSEHACSLALLLFVLDLGGAGCSSIYQATQATLPPEPAAQLKLRIAEAQHAEQIAGQAIMTLRDQLHQGRSGAAVEPDIDRVALTAFELDRRVAAARDATAHGEGDPQLVGELERLQQRSQELLDCLQAAHRGGNPIDAQQLDALLPGSTKP